MSPVTILDVAKARGVQEGEHGISGGEFDRVGLPMMGGCEVCGATVAAYNACPSTTGYLRCRSGCIYEDGFATVEAFEAWAATEDEKEAVTITVTGKFVSQEAGDAFCDAFNEWARNPEIDELFGRTTDTPTGEPESDYRIAWPS